MLEFLKIVVNAISSWPKDPAQAMRLAIGYWMVQLVRNSPEPTARLTDLITQYANSRQTSRELIRLVQSEYAHLQAAFTNTLVYKPGAMMARNRSILLAIAATESARLTAAVTEAVGWSEGEKEDYLTMMDYFRTEALFSAMRAEMKARELPYQLDEMYRACQATIPVSGLLAFVESAVRLQVPTDNAMLAKTRALYVMPEILRQYQQEFGIEQTNDIIKQVLANYKVMVYGIRPSTSEEVLDRHIIQTSSDLIPGPAVIAVSPIRVYEEDDTTGGLIHRLMSLPVGDVKIPDVGIATLRIPDTLINPQEKVPTLQTWGTVFAAERMLDIMNGTAFETIASALSHIVELKRHDKQDVSTHRTMHFGKFLFRMPNLIAGSSTKQFMAIIELTDRQQLSGSDTDDHARSDFLDTIRRFSGTKVDRVLTNGDVVTDLKGAEMAFDLFHFLHVLALRKRRDLPSLLAPAR